MARITPVKLPSSSKTLWFDANDIDAPKNAAVIVQTTRGTEYGMVAEASFEASPEQLDSLKSALKPVVRLATAQDAQRLEELQQQAHDMMPAYRELVEEEGLDMRPVSIEVLFDGDKAVFYFEADDRIDFRELVRKLASKFKIRVDMRQIGPRDEARMVGGLGHCGQELCCKRLGGEFCPVSIRMAKEQDLSLNPQKISGICGRLMCCLRYEYDAYKDFKSRAPKLGATIDTPQGPGKVVLLDVPKEMVTIQVDDDKKVNVPLCDMTTSNSETTRPDTVNNEAWERATNQEGMAVFGEANFLTSQFTSTDKLSEAKAIHREPSNKKEKRERRDRQNANSNREQGSKTRGNGRGGSGRASNVASEQGEPAHRVRRRSTKLVAGQTLAPEQTKASAAHKAAPAGNHTKLTSSSGAAHAQNANNEAGTSSRRHRARKSVKLAAPDARENARESVRENMQDNQALRPGRRSSGLRAHAAGATSGANRNEQRNEQRGSQRSTPRDAQQGAQSSAQHAGQRDAQHRRPRSRKNAGQNHTTQNSNAQNSNMKGSHHKGSEGN